MPLRKTPLVNNEIYHLFNRGVEYRPIFSSVYDYRRFLKTVNFYRFSSLPFKLSLFLNSSRAIRKEILKKLVDGKKDLVEIFCFCLMPNHFHFLLKQLKDNGISNVLRLLQNSYSKYFNIKMGRVGSLFQGPFKAIRVETDEQAIHLSRYIHLNPYSSYVVKSTLDLETYRWSSLPDYLGRGSYSFVKKKFIQSFFKNKERYRDFIFDRADYQRDLANIKHLILEKG